MLLIPLIPLTVNAETVLKTSFMFSYEKLEEAELKFLSGELKFEQSLYKNIGIGTSLRKENGWKYSGYYLSLYSTYKTKLSNRFVTVSLGAEYGIASPGYEHYITIYDESGNLIAHKWIYLVQNAPIPFGKIKKGNISVVHPFVEISGENKIWKKLFVETGFRVQILRFGVKSCKFEPDALVIHERKIWKLIPSAFIQIGYKL